MYLSPLRGQVEWPDIPPGERSDHGTPGHALFLGPIADAIDIGRTYQVVQAVHGLEIYEAFHHYSSKDGQDYGYVIKCRLDDGRRVVYAHLQELPAKSRYERGEQIGIVSDILNYDHLHFEAEGIAAGDFKEYFGGDTVDDQGIKDLFERAIGRLPTEGEIIARRGQTYEQVRKELMHTDERYDRIRDDGYEALLGRAGTGKEVAAWRDSDKPLLLIFEELRQSPEGKAHAGIDTKAEQKIAKIKEIIG